MSDNNEDRLEQATIEQIKEVLENSSHLYPLNDDSVTEQCLHYRSHLSAVEYQLWLERGVFEVSYDTDQGTFFSDDDALTHLESMRINDNQYYNQLIVNYQRMPDSDVFPQKEIDTLIELCNSCEHLASFEPQDNIICFYPTDKDIIYRIYQKERQILVIHNNTNWMSVDENDFQKFIKTIQVNEYRFQKTLEEITTGNMHLQKLL
jgi:hypothetical protein